LRACARGDFPLSCAADEPPGVRACRGGSERFSVSENITRPGGQRQGIENLKGSKMPKLKTKSGVKKRFKVTASGKIKFTQAGKRHGMIKRTTKFIRQARGTSVLDDSDARIVKKFIPYGLN
jgi:large subunit ribosomal protein L35